MDLIRSIDYFLVNQYYNWKQFLVYRLQASIYLLDSALAIVFTFITISVIYNVSGGIPGWSYYQLLLLSSLTTMIVGLAWYVVNPWFITNSMTSGRVDSILIRPYGAFTLLLSNFTDTPTLFMVISSLLMAVYAGLNAQITLVNVLIYLPISLAGTIAFLTFLVMLAVLAYHVLKSGAFVSRLIDMLESLGRYPLSIYGFPVQLFFTLVIPVGAASYYPANTLIGRIDPLSYLLLLGSSIAIAVISYKLFYMLMKYYTSGGG